MADELVERIKSVDCYELPISSLTEAGAFVRGLSQGPVALAKGAA